MAITKSAKKAIRSSERKRVFNLRRSRLMQDVIKDLDKAILAGKMDEAQKLLALAYQKIDKAAKLKTIDKNTASRKKSRLAAKIRKAKAAKK